MKASSIDRRKRAAAARTARPWFAGIALPLAMVAAFLSEPLFVVPLVACIWWWAPRGLWWLDFCGRGLVGTAWALLGSSALQTWPDDRLAVGFWWITSALVLAAASKAMARRAARSRAPNLGSSARSKREHR